MADLEKARICLEEKRCQYKQIQPITSGEKVWMVQKKRYDKLDRR